MGLSWGSTLVWVCRCCRLLLEWVCRVVGLWGGLFFWVEFVLGWFVVGLGCTDLCRVGLPWMGLSWDGLSWDWFVMGWVCP